MANSNKFEEMLEHLINEDREKAEELFHEIVVAKSRDIYENLLADDLDEADEKMKNADGEDEGEVGDASKHKAPKKNDAKMKEESDEDDDDDEDLDEDFNLDEFEVEGDDGMDMGDPEGDMAMDMGDEGEDDMDMDMDAEGDDDAPATQGDIKDLEAELEDLKA